MERVLGSHSETGINSFTPHVPRPRLLNVRVVPMLQVSVRSAIAVDVDAHDSDSATRTRTR